MEAHVCNLSSGRQRQEVQKFKVILGYIASLRPAQALCHLFGKKESHVLGIQHVSGNVYPCCIMRLHCPGTDRQHALCTLLHIQYMFSHIQCMLSHIQCMLSHTQCMQQMLPQTSWLDFRLLYVMNCNVLFYCTCTEFSTLTEIYQLNYTK